MENKKKRRHLDAQSTTSDVPGLTGQVETFLRKFRNFAYIVFLIPVALMALLSLGISISPGVFIVKWTYGQTLEWHPILHNLSIGVSVAVSYFVYGFSLIFVAPLMNLVVPKPKPWRGIWFSVAAIPWFYHNALVYIVRYTFLELVTPSPLNILFYRMMGMKIGKGVMINSTNISDPCLITLEDYVTIGGSAHLFAHYGQKGILILSSVRIGKGTTVGLKASIMGDVIIGESVNVKPHTVLLPKSRIQDGETI